MQQSAGIVVRGHRVASGLCGDPRFPHGTIAPQLPFLERAIPGLAGWLGGAPYPGTINLDFAGRQVRYPAPDWRLEGIGWTEALPPENFLLARCRLVHRGTPWPALAYCPDPATKVEHHQPGSIVELIARFVPDLCYGDAVTLIHDPTALAIIPA